MVPYKGNLASKIKLTKPLHNPLAKDALVLFNPQDLFGEKYVLLFPSSVFVLLLIFLFSKVGVVVDPILSA